MFYNYYQSRRSVGMACIRHDERFHSSSLSQTNDELRITEEHHMAVQDKSNELHLMAEKERSAMKKDLDGVRRDLKNINAELEETKKQYLTYCGSCDYCLKKLKADAEELQVLRVKEDNAKSKEAMQATKVKDLKEHIVHAEYEHGRLNKYIDNLTKEKNTKFEANKALRAKLETEIVRKTEDHRQLFRKNKEMKMDIEDMEHKIKVCEKQKEKDEKNVIRMRKEMERTEKLMEVTEDELGQAQILNTTLKEQLRAEEDKCCATEEQLRSTAEALKRQVKDEIHNRSVLVARINSDTSESEKFEVEANEKMIKANKKLEEVRTAVEKIMGKVNKFRQEVDNRRKSVREWEEKIAILKEAHDAMEKSTSQELMSLTPIHEELMSAMQTRDDGLPSYASESEMSAFAMAMDALDKRLAHMEKKTLVMKAKMEDMEASSAMMEKSFKNTSKLIDNLTEIHEELNIQIETTKRLDDEAVAAIDDVTARINYRAKVHRDLMKERRDVYAKQEEELWDLLKVNDVLAQRYRALQNDYMILKNLLLNTYDDKVLNENMIRDVRQLQSLQKRMQAAMLEYFKYRGLYNQAELSRLDNNSTYNGMRVGQLKEHMDACLNKIAHFLIHQFNADSIHKMAMDKVAKDEALEKSRQEAAKSLQQSQPVAG